MPNPHSIEPISIDELVVSCGPLPTTWKNSKSSPYLQGPIPWDWLQRATALGGSALATGLALWHLKALNRHTRFTASLYRLTKWSRLSEKATRSGLRRLEEAGLVEVRRPNGRSPSVTLLELPTERSGRPTL